jgi:hypothetical protein
MRFLIGLAAALALAGCVTQPERVAIDVGPLCAGAWRQINVRPEDKLTEPTAIAIEANNVAREAAGCKYEKPATMPKPAQPAPRVS